MKSGLAAVLLKSPPRETSNTVFSAFNLVWKPATQSAFFQTIQEVQPDVVVVELCQYRVSMLKMDERTLLKEAKEINLEKLQQAIKQVWILQWQSHLLVFCVGLIDCKEAEIRISSVFIIYCS